MLQKTPFLISGLHVFNNLKGAEAIANHCSFGNYFHVKKNLFS